MAQIPLHFSEHDDDTPDGEPSRFIPTSDWQQVAEAGYYQGYAKDLDFMWRWIIVRDGSVVQEGCSISLESSTRAVQQVFSFYAVADASRANAPAAP
jgi:soluble methane monooxygenase-binding protein MmoD